MDGLLARIRETNITYVALQNVDLKPQLNIPLEDRDPEGRIVLRDIFWNKL
jgi:hypothetical protein